MKIYVASSWRNDLQPSVVEALRNNGHEVYDFRNPSETDKGFSWSEIDPEWQKWTTSEYRDALQHPAAVSGFNNDFNGMKWADCCVMVMPCGRSAHTEAGWMQGQGKPTIVLIPNESEPELMYKCFDFIALNIDEVLCELSFMEVAKSHQSDITNEEFPIEKINDQLAGRAELQNIKNGR